MASGSDQPQLPRGLIGRRGTPSGKGTRLPSIRGPRDLTLGGIPKKVYTPNIPARRDKPKESSEPEPPNSGEGKKSRNDASSRESRDGRGRGQGRGRGRGWAANVIQSHSIFEQGPTEKTRRPGSGYEPGMRSESSGGGGSKISTKKERTDVMTKEVLDHLLRDDFIAHGDDTEDDVTLLPVKLPLQIKTEIDVKTEEPDFTKVKVKSEPMEVDGETTAKPPVVDDKKSALNAKSEPRPVSCTDLFTNPAKSEAGQLMFFQLPDALPGMPPTTDEDFKKKPDKDKTEESLAKKMIGCNLDDFSEGQIGKLIVRKSGRVQMLLGNTLLDVSMGTPCGFLQDLVSVHTEGEEGNMSVLGHIDHRLVCTPDFEALLHTS